MILIIDNYDSFTYNLYQAIAELYGNGAHSQDLTARGIKVVRNDQITIDEVERLNPKGIILSPGPGRPESAGICLQLIGHFGSRIPILGVCLGHQAIALVYGGKVERSPEILHGKDSLIFHKRQKLFKGMPLPFRAGRYHSLLVEKMGLAAEISIDAETSEGLIMALSHKTDPVFGVQFHPESLLTPEGNILLKNFLEICK